MKQFCKECGKEANKEHHFCLHCGTTLTKVHHEATSESTEPVEPIDPTEPKVPKKPKEPMSKRKKILWGSVIGLLIALFSLHTWAQSYFSPASTKERFDTAITEADAKKLTKIVVHEDGTSIHEQEAKAFLELIKAEGKQQTKELTIVAKNGKFIGLYDTYKVEVVDQFAQYDQMMDGLLFEFNGQTAPVHEEEDEYITYGPFAPGIYTVDAIFTGDYGETSMEESLTLDKTSRDSTWIGMEIPISMVTFYVENYNEIDPSKASILINEEEISLSDEGKTEEVGPFIVDGSQHAKTVVSMPWGEVTSEDIEIDASEMYITADLLASDAYTDLTETLKDFGEQYLKATAEQSTKPLKVATDPLKEEIKKGFDDGSLYSGKLKKVEIDKGSITINQQDKTPEITILARYTVEESQDPSSDKEDLYEDVHTWNIDLSFNEKDEKWSVTNQAFADIWGDMTVSDEIEGDHKLYSPSEEALANADSKGDEEALEDFIVDYTIASVDAINARDFDLVKHYMTESGPRRNEAKDYIDYLDSKDIYEEYYGAKVEKVKEIDDTTWKVTIIEEFDIIKPDTSDIKEFRTVVHVKEVDGQYYVDELIETNEI